MGSQSELPHMECAHLCKTMQAFPATCVEQGLPPIHGWIHSAHAVQIATALVSTLPSLTLLSQIQLMCTLGGDYHWISYLEEYDPACLLGARGEDALGWASTNQEPLKFCQCPSHQPECPLECHCRTIHHMVYCFDCERVFAADP